MNIISRFWAGREMPQEYVDYGKRWQDLNKTYKVITWTENEIHNIRSKFPYLSPVFDDLYRRDNGRQGIELYVQLADVVGYALVALYGGVYVNTDMQPVRPLSGLPLRPWASYENDEDGRIVNAAIGAAKVRDEFWVGLLEELPYRYFSNPGAEMVEATGPAFLTDYERANPGLLEVLPKNTFNPIHWKQIAPGGDAKGFEYPAETIAVHHWGHKKDGRSNTVETATQ